jgi:hypothetical protein
MQKRIFYLPLIVVCFACGSKTSKNDNDNVNTDTTLSLSTINEQNNYYCIDENKIFNDTTWFLPYVDVATRDTLRAVFEQWKFQLPVDEGFDKGCEITLTLYKDSTYIYQSPCEWVAELLTGTYFYCKDTLYCVEIGIGMIEGSDGLPKVICLDQYIKQSNQLKCIWSKRQFIDKLHIQKAPNELIFEKTK